MGAALVIPLVYAVPLVISGATIAVGGLAIAIKTLVERSKVPPKAPAASAVSWARKRGATTEAFLSDAKKAIGISRRKYNIALCGVSGVGKSSLVAAITGASVRVGAEGETTDKAAGYEVPGTDKNL